MRQAMDTGDEKFLPLRDKGRRSALPVTMSTPASAWAST